MQLVGVGGLLGCDHDVAVGETLRSGAGAVAVCMLEDTFTYLINEMDHI
jgi:hypothetical protein